MYKLEGVMMIWNQEIKLTTASAEKSVLMQSSAGVDMMCVWYRPCLKFKVTTLVQTLDRDLKQKNQIN